MKLFKKIVALTMACCMVFALAACGESGGGGQTTAATTAAPAETTTAAGGGDTTAAEGVGGYTAENPLVLIFGHYGSGELHPSNIVSNLLKEKLEEKSGGAITLEIYENGALGYDDDLLQAVSKGTVDFCPTNPFTMNAYCDELKVLDLFYLFEDDDHFWKGYYGSDIYDEINHLLVDSMDVVTLGQQAIGWRVIATRDAEVHNVGDLAGLRLRMSPSAIFTEEFTKWGASPQSMAAQEFIPALQQGVVDGCDMPTSIQYQDGNYQYCKVMSETYHLMQLNFLNTNYSKLMAYPEEVRNIIIEAAEEAAYEAGQKSYEADAEATRLLRDEYDCTFVEHEDIDIDSLRDIALAYHTEFLEKYPQCQHFYDEIMALGD